MINQEVLSRAIPIFNVHCASTKDYPRIGSIHRALSESNLDQNATLHRVTTAIDGRPILDIELFALSPRKSYCLYEDVAYQTRIRLLLVNRKGRGRQEYLGNEGKCP